MKVLLIEDDEAIIAALSHNLANYHYVLDAVTDGTTGWTYATTYEYDLIILDIMLPKMNGIRFCEWFREEGYTTPILLLTVLDTSHDKVRGLDAGADDYVVKPFEINELSARIRALLRRGKASPFPLLMWEDLILNPSTLEVTYKDQPLTLTVKEYELLELFLRDCKHVFSSEEILDKLWSSEEFPVEATVRSHIRRLRNKLVSAGAPHDFISTIHGRGYYLKPLPQEPPAQPVATDSTVDTATATQQAYVEFLNETWATTQPRCLAQLSTIADTVHHLRRGTLVPEQQEAAKQVAHKLIGTLGVFDLTEGVHLAQALDNIMRHPLRVQSADRLETLLSALRQLLEQTFTIRPSQVPNQRSPLLWLIAPDHATLQALDASATCLGFRTAVATSITEASSQLTSELSLDRTKQPDAVLVQFPPELTQVSVLDPRFREYWAFFQVLAKHYPNSPILLAGRDFALEDRLELNRRSNKLYLESSLDPATILKAVKQLLTWQERSTKVMVVDDDFSLLQTLPSLLTPWGFNVSTLAEPKQFWSVLEAVKPDVLILDLNLPEVNGIELCQLLRSDLRWRQLPVLFLSSLTDPYLQQEVFTAGADDYVLKPVAAAELAYRIRNQLQRL